MHPSLRALLAAPIAHRGLHGGEAFPVENSIAAAEAAIAAGYGIECDIQLSRDGEAMVFHDERLERLTAGSGRIRDQDAAALKTLVLRDGGDRIPTLAAFLDAIGGRAPLVVEVKTTGDGDMRLADRAVALLAHHVGIVALESFDPAVVAHFRATDVAFPVGLVGPLENGREMPIGQFDFLSWNIDHVGAVAARYPDVPLITWTVRTTAQRSLAAHAKAQIVFEGFAP